MTLDFGGVQPAHAGIAVAQNRAEDNARKRRWTEMVLAVLICFLVNSIPSSDLTAKSWRCETGAGSAAAFARKLIATHLSLHAETEGKSYI